MQDFTNSDILNYAFGLTPLHAAQALRALANQVEAREVNIQKVTQTHAGSHDTFHETTLTLVYNRMLRPFASGCKLEDDNEKG